MNCVNHQEIVAVASCNHCSVGLCKQCIDQFLRFDNKPLCKECSLKYVDEGLAELDNSLLQLRTKKIIWSIILLIGLVFIVLAWLEPNGSDAIFKYLVGFFIWSLAGFSDRFQRNENRALDKSAMSEALLERDMYKDGTIWIAWLFKFAFAIIRGIFFPIFYALLMLNGNKKLHNEIANLKELKEKVSQ